jgi:hypothetical protein
MLLVSFQRERNGFTSSVFKGSNPLSLNPLNPPSIVRQGNFEAAKAARRVQSVSTAPRNVGTENSLLVCDFLNLIISSGSMFDLPFNWALTPVS